MKTLRLIPLAAMVLTIVVAALATAGTNVDARLKIDVDYRPGPDLDVYVWPDRGVDGVYHPGDPIRIFFEATRDCYVVIYDIDTRGRIHILFPFDPWQDNFIEGGRVYELPGDWDDYRLTVEGPAGIEYIQAVASPHPFDLPDWPVYLNSPGPYPVTCTDPDLLDFRAGTDRIRYINRINRKLIRRHWDWTATDLARFFVRRRPAWHEYPYHGHINYDPWPHVFYGEIYIGWPPGMRIYVDGIFMGITPCWIRGIPHGYHWVRCYDGHRLVHEKRVRYRHKRWFRQDHPDYRLRGKTRTRVYRTGRGGPSPRADRPRNEPLSVKKQHRGDVFKDREDARGGRRGQTVDTKKRKNPTQEVDRARRGSLKAERKTGARVKIKTERSTKSSGLKRFVSSIGRTVAGELGKSQTKKRTSSGAKAGKSKGKVEKRKAPQGKKKSGGRPPSKKRR